MDGTPRMIPIFFGLVMFMLGALILGALAGVVPTDGGRFLAPEETIAALGFCLILGGILLWLPRQTPAKARSAVFLGAVGLLALVCNWTAFAPEVVFTSTTSIGPLSTSGEEQAGGRIVFGLAAIVLDVLILLGTLMWARSLWLSYRRE